VNHAGLFREALELAYQMTCAPLEEAAHLVGQLNAVLEDAVNGGTVTRARLDQALRGRLPAYSHRRKEGFDPFDAFNCSA
jgi:hypothetical protein